MRKSRPLARKANDLVAAPLKFREQALRFGVCGVIPTGWQTRTIRSRVAHVRRRLAYRSDQIIMLRQNALLRTQPKSLIAAHHLLTASINPDREVGCAIARVNKCPNPIFRLLNKCGTHKLKLKLNDFAAAGMLAAWRFVTEIFQNLIHRHWTRGGAFVWQKRKIDEDVSEFVEVLRQLVSSWDTHTPEAL